MGKHITKIMVLMLILIVLILGRNDVRNQILDSIDDSTETLDKQIKISLQEIEN